MSARILRGSVEDVLPSLETESFDAVLSDPPYGLGFMGKSWDHGVPGAPVWAEVARALRPGGHILAFGGTRTFHRLTCAIEDAGFEIRDCLCWLYGSGFPKSLDVSAAIDKAAGVEREVVGEKPGHPCGGMGLNAYGHWDKQATNPLTAPATFTAKRFSGYGTALKPAWEPCILAMKPTSGTFAENALAHGVAGIAVDASRIEGCAPYAYPNGPKGDNSPTGWSKPRRDDPVESHPLGRWPANVLLDAEAAEQLDAQSGFSRSPDVGQNASITPNGHGDSGGAARFFYTAKADRAERDEGLHHLEEQRGGSEKFDAGKRDGVGAERMPMVRNTHPTVKPIDLCGYLARMLLPPPRADGAPRRILVPFSGSGSEMIGCLNAGWDEVVGIEREAEYAEIARARIVARFGLLHSVEVAA